MIIGSPAVFIAPDYSETGQFTVSIAITMVMRYSYCGGNFSLFEHYVNPRIQPEYYKWGADTDILTICGIMSSESTKSRQAMKEVRKSLFDNWLSLAPVVNEVTHREDWYAFFQLVVKSLKDSDETKIYQFLDFYLPQMFDAAIPRTEFDKSLASLRSLLIEHIVNDDNISMTGRDLLVNKILAIFESLERYIQEKYSLQSSPGSANNHDRIEAGLQRLNVMAFYSIQERFNDTAFLSPIFMHKLGLNTDKNAAKVNWEDLIHPEDFHQLKLILKTLIRRKEPLYEMSYRMITPDETWQHVTEIGRITYDPNGRAIAFSGVLTEASTEYKPHLHGEELKRVCRWLLYDPSDVTMVVNLDGHLMFATPLLSDCLPATLQGAIPHDNLRNGNGHPVGQRAFFDHLDPETRAIASNFWDSLIKARQLSRKMLLKLKNRKRNQTQIFEFAAFPIQKPFNLPVYFLWGKEVPRRTADHEFMDRSKTLHTASGELARTSDLEQFYARLAEMAMRIIPNAQAACVLLKSIAGYRYKTGLGYNNAALKDALLLRTMDIKHIDSLRQFESSGEESRIIAFEDLREELGEHLPDPQLDLLIEHGRFEETYQMITARLRYQDDIHATIAVVNFTAAQSFNALDRSLLQLFAQGATQILDTLLFRQQVSEMELNLEAMFDQSPLGIAVLQDGMIASHNTRFLEIIGYGAIPPQLRRFNALVHADDYQALLPQLTELQHSGHKFDHEFRILGANQREIHCQGTFLASLHERQPAVIVQIADLSRLARLEEQLLHAQKMETIGGLTLGIAHDFNNILGAVLPTAQLIDQFPDAPETAKRGRIIFDMAQRADAITKQLISYARGGQDSEKRVNLNYLIEETRDILAKICGPSIRMEYFLARKLPSINADPNQIVQLLLNLINNATDAMPDGGHIQIGTRISKITQNGGPYDAFEPGTYVQLTVKDTGKGIPQEIRDKIYEPFFTTKSVEKSSGLGLSIVSGILKKHDGYVLLQSRENKGSTFKIFLPAGKQMVETAPPAPVNGEFKTGQGNILIVDDEFYLREVLGSMVSLMGYTHDEAASGEAALELFESKGQSYDLVILDYAMAGMNGKDTFTALRKLDPHIKVILCTGYAEQNDITDILNEPGVELLAKPFTIETLSTRLHAIAGEEVSPAAVLKH